MPPGPWNGPLKAVSATLHITPTVTPSVRAKVPVRLGLLRHPVSPFLNSPPVPLHLLRPIRTCMLTRLTNRPAHLLKQPTVVVERGRTDVMLSSVIPSHTPGLVHIQLFTLRLALWNTPRTPLLLLCIYLQLGNVPATPRLAKTLGLILIIELDPFAVRLAQISPGRPLSLNTTWAARSPAALPIATLVRLVRTLCVTKLVRWLPEQNSVLAVKMLPL